MPADGELQFRHLLKLFLSRELGIAKDSQCMKSGFLNGLMMFVAGYAAGYAYFYNPRKAFVQCGLPAFALTTLITVAICNKNEYDTPDR